MIIANQIHPIFLLLFYILIISTYFIIVWIDIYVFFLLLLEITSNKGNRLKYNTNFIKFEYFIFLFTLLSSSKSFSKNISFSIFNTFKNNSFCIPSWLTLYWFFTLLLFLQILILALSHLLRILFSPIFITHKILIYFYCLLREWCLCLS